MKYNVLILGASYGSLFSTKLLMAGHGVSLVCTRPTAELINREGTVVRFPIRGRQSPVDISSKKLPGALRATTRSEEHTSELQSQSNLVCRLLLEKKKELKAGGRGVLQNKPHRSPDMLATPSRRCVRVR